MLDLYQKKLLQGVAPHRFAPTAPPSGRKWWPCSTAWLGSRRCSGASGFADVPAGAWYAAPLRWAEEKGIAQGTGEGTFAPGRPVTRQELAVFLYRYAQAQGEDVSRQASLAGYRDSAAVAPWAREAVQWAVGEGILQGTQANTLGPGGDRPPGPSWR